MRIVVIGNPKAGAGKAASRLRVFSTALTSRGANVELLQTERRGHASELARQALCRCDVLAVVGGDGTLHEVCQAWVNERGEAVQNPPHLSYLPAGTGRDTARSLGVGSKIEDAVERTLEGTPQPLDLGWLSLGASPHRGETFVNIASFGLSSWGAKAAELGPKWLGGKASYMYAAAKAALQYKNVAVEVIVDGTPWYQGLALSVVLANGKFFGGGMKVAPNAELNSGKLEVVCIGDVRLAEFARVFPKVYSGEHLSLPAVQRVSATSVTVRAMRPTSFSEVEADGETPGELPIEARIVPAAAEILL